MSGWTQTPNFIYDHLPDMKEAEIKVVMAIVRETIGWQKESVSLSFSDLHRLTKLARASINSGIQAAIKRGIIERTEDGQSFIYKIVEPLPPSELVQNLNHLDETSSNFEPEVVQNLDQELVQNLNSNKRNINTNTSKEGETPARKVVHLKSPHLDPRHFVNGYIPPGAGTNAVEVYYERFSINQDAARLNAIKEDDLNRLCPDLDKLRSVIVAYSRTTFQPGNVQLILDWYGGGVPEKHKPPATNGNGNSAMSEAKRNALATRADLARKSLASATKFKTAINPEWQRDIDAAKAAGVI